MARPKGSTNKPKAKVTAAPARVAERPAAMPKVRTGMSPAYIDGVNSDCDDIEAEFPFGIVCPNTINPFIVLPFKHGHFVRPERFGHAERTFCFKTKANLLKFKEIVRMK